MFQLTSIFCRYVDIVLGLSFLLTHLVLMYSSKHESRSHLTLYFVLSVSTLLLYWAWFVYLKYAVGESEASKEVRPNNWVLFMYSAVSGGRYCLLYNHSIYASNNGMYRLSKTKRIVQAGVCDLCWDPGNICNCPFLSHLTWDILELSLYIRSSFCS